MDICLPVLKESNKSRCDSYSVRNGELIVSHITFWDCRVHIFPTTFLEIPVYRTCTCMRVFPRDKPFFLCNEHNCGKIKINRSFKYTT